MSEELQHMENGRVLASAVIYPGVRVAINSIMKNIQSELKFCTLLVKGDEVAIEAYDA